VPADPAMISTIYAQTLIDWVHSRCSGQGEGRPNLLSRAGQLDPDAVAEL
jgi:hypothetical protein